MDEVAGTLLSQLYDRPSDVPGGLSVFYIGHAGAAYGHTLTEEDAKTTPGYEDVMRRWREKGDPEEEPCWCRWDRKPPTYDDDPRAFMPWGRIYIKGPARECAGCGEKRPHAKDDYICMVCRRIAA